MRCLIDTQILIWALACPDKLSSQSRSLLQSQQILVSQISFFEVAIKQKIGKLPELPVPVAALSLRAVRDGLICLGWKPRTRGLQCHPVTGDPPRHGIAWDHKKPASLAGFGTVWDGLECLFGAEERT